MTLKKYPYLSVLIPTYNRRAFKPLLCFNISNMLYDKNKLQIVIFDDGDDKLFYNDEEINIFKKYTGITDMLYIKKDTKGTSGTKFNIGYKRNYMVRQSKHNYLINMDDDDIYNPLYFKYAIENLILNNKGLVGCKDMLFTYTEHNYKLSYIKCVDKSLIHEATMCFTKKFHKLSKGFNNVGHAEGYNMIQNRRKDVIDIEVRYCMICVAHPKNSVNKLKFLKANENYIKKASIDKEYIDILKVITFG
jgi:hypothetical protein